MIERLSLVTFLILIFISSVLPSGFIFGIPLKHLCFFTTFLFLIISVTKNIKLFIRPTSVRSLIYVFIFIFLIAFIFLTPVLNHTYQFSLAFSDFQSIFLTFLFFLFADLVFYCNNITYLDFYNKIFKTAFYGIVIFMLFKLSLVFLTLFQIIDFNFIDQTIYPIINYKPVGLEIFLIGSRFSFITLDLLSVIIFLLLIYDWHNKIISKKFKLLFILLFTVSLFSAYSRLLFVITPVLLILIYLIKKRFVKLILFFIISIILIAFNFELIGNIIEHRFFDQSHTDSHRNMMVKELLNYWSKSILFGHGYGSYIPNYIRSYENSYSYEVQLLSIFMRFGITPLVFLCLVELYLISQFLKNFLASTFFVFILFNVILIASFTNQYLFSTASNVMLLLLYIFYLSKIELSSKQIND